MYYDINQSLQTKSFRRRSWRTPFSTYGHIIFPDCQIEGDDCSATVQLGHPSKKENVSEIPRVQGRRRRELMAFRYFSITEIFDSLVRMLFVLVMECDGTLRHLHFLSIHRICIFYTLFCSSLFIERKKKRPGENSPRVYSIQSITQESGHFMYRNKSNKKKNKIKKNLPRHPAELYTALGFSSSFHRL